MTESRRLKLDLLSGYLLTATRVGAWAVIFGMLYRFASPEAAATYAFARSIIAFVPVVMLNIPQALYWRLSIPIATPSATDEASGSRTINYASPATDAVTHGQIFLSAATCVLVIGLLSGFAFQLVSAFFGEEGMRWWDIDGNIVRALVGAAIVRIGADVVAVTIQRAGKQWQDNLAVMVFEIVPAVFVCLLPQINPLAQATFGTALLLLVIRCALYPGTGARKANTSIAESFNMLSYGAKVSLSQLADLLYAPLTLLLLGTFAHKLHLATYSTLLQFDAALLLLTAAITTTLTPRVSNLLSANDPRTALRYTFKATGISFAILTAAAVTLYFTAQPILNLWLGSTPAGLLTVLPIFLIHTVIGGASAPLRAVLLLAGKAKQLTIANTLGGLAVATATFLILKYPTYTTQTTGLLPLQAIAAATALSVTLRCALWMPWYTRRVLNRR